MAWCAKININPITIKIILWNDYYTFKNKKDKLYLQRTKDFFMKMLSAIEEYQEGSHKFHANDIYHITNISIEQACEKAYDFFISIGDKESAKKFKNN
jgi:hypothetical protein